MPYSRTVDKIIASWLESFQDHLAKMERPGARVTMDEWFPPFSDDDDNRNREQEHPTMIPKVTPKHTIDWSPDTLTHVQTQLRPWQQHNFPDRPAWQPLVGMAEELGEIADSLAPEDPLTPHLKELSGAVGKISHGFLKMEQDIRGDRKVHQAEINDGLADLMVYACDFANALEIDLSNVLRDTWATVRRRDWAAERRARAGQRAEPIIIDDLPAIAAPLADVLGSVDGDRCPACRHKIKRHEADDSELAAGCDRVDCSCTLDGLQIRLLYSLIRAASRHDNIVVSQILARGYDHEAGRA